MFKKKTKKDIYNENHLIDLHTYVNGETAIKPYWYLRNELLHIRYTVDRCITLSEAEIIDLKKKLSEKPADKQGILENTWKFFTDCVGKDIIMDGIAELEKRMKRTE